MLLCSSIVLFFHSLYMDLLCLFTCKVDEKIEQLSEHNSTLSKKKIWKDADKPILEEGSKLEVCMKSRTNVVIFSWPKLRVGQIRIQKSATPSINWRTCMLNLQEKNKELVCYSIKIINYKRIAIIWVIRGNQYYSTQT